MKASAKLVTEIGTTGFVFEEHKCWFKELQDLVTTYNIKIKVKQRKSLKVG
jgi:hypothetical protein